MIINYLLIFLRLFNYLLHLCNYFVTFYCYKEIVYSVIVSFMNTFSSRINVTKVDPKSLSWDDIASLAEVTQDMWADGIWEFVQCEECGHMHSKKDIFWWLIPQIYSLTVRKLMGDFEIDTLSCHKCSGDVRFVYGKANIEVIRDRLLKTKESFLVVASHEKWDIVWYEDAYIWSLEDIFYREFETHYRYVGVEEIRKRIFNVLGFSPDELLVLSDIWLLGKYRNFQNLFQILSKFSRSIPPENDKIPGFTELDKENSLYKISQSLWWISLWIDQDIQLGNKISNIWKGYKSDLIVYHRVAEIYRKNFSEWTARWLVSLMRWKVAKNLPTEISTDIPEQSFA